jgi:hypothetical protein
MVTYVLHRVIVQLNLGGGYMMCPANNDAAEENDNSKDTKESMPIRMS